MKFLLPFCFLATVTFVVGCGSESTTSESDSVAVVTPESSYITGKWSEAGESPETLAVGDQAPAIRTSAWLKGDEREGFEKGKVHVVEFWATWCGPCLHGMPHLSELSEKYADDTVFIGVTAEDTDTVTEFLKGPSLKDDSVTWSEAIKYNLVCDDADANTNVSYMEAANRQGIPCAFLISREGNVEWIGHPMELDEPLEKVVAGTWDREAEMIAAEKKRAEDEKKQELLQKHGQDYETAMRTQDFEKALKAIEGLEEITEQDMGAMKINILGELGRNKEARAILVDVKDSNWDDPQTLVGVAWMISSELKGELKDLDMALECAERANELSKESVHQVWDTLGLVRFERGEFAKAVEAQSKAAELEPKRSAARSGITQRLEKYQVALKEATKPDDSAKDDKKSEEDADEEPQEEDEKQKETEAEEDAPMKNQPTSQQPKRFPQSKILRIPSPKDE